MAIDLFVFDRGNYPIGAGHNGKNCDLVLVRGQLDPIIQLNSQS